MLTSPKRPPTASSPRCTPPPNRSFTPPRSPLVMTDTLTNQLETIGEEECAHLLATHHFGRAAFVADGRPIILPVNYLYDDPSIVMRTSPGSKVVHMPQTDVAFQIDDADHNGRWGWSVLAQGIAYDITGAIDEYSARLRELCVMPWAPGSRTHWLAITALELSGRR